MFRITSTTVLAATLLAGPVLADATVTIGIEGYDDFFKRCKIDVQAEAGAGVDEMSVLYRVLAKGVGGEMCEKFSNGTGCRGSDDFKPKCEQITSVDVLHAKCTDANGAVIPCGAVKAKAGAGMSVPVGTKPAPSSLDGTLLFASLLGGPDYSNRCSVGMLYTAPEAVRQVKVNYEMLVNGGAAECSLNMGGPYGTGRSCHGADDFTCDAVKSVKITSVKCETDEDETDCGPVTIHGTEPDVFVDAR